jgi:hypothetical protein
MKLAIHCKVEIFPKRISVREALDFYQRQRHWHGILMVVGAGWRLEMEPGEEDWFEELGPEEFEDEDFLEEFADAELQLWTR